MKIKNLGIAAVAAMFAAGSTGTAALAVSGNESADSSAATITLSGCVIDSSKEISNIEYFTDGASVTKDETFNTSSFDLTTVEGIENIDTVAVKAGTTVKTFTISCAPAAAPDDGTDDGAPDEEIPGDGSDDDSAPASPGSSAATITLSGCVIDSSKEISNIEYFADGASVTKDETFSTSSFDLTTVEGIEDIDTVAVKAGTTVKTFTISCAPAAAPDDGTVPEDGSIEGGSAIITLSGCVLNSTKDISNIGYYSDGTLVAKDESINTRSYDLTTVTGIEDIDTVAVKSSTTVETFTISCAPDTSPDGGTGNAAAGNSGDSTMSS